jgi:hypothetical protein
MKKGKSKKKGRSEKEEEQVAKNFLPFALFFILHP